MSGKISPEVRRRYAQSAKGRATSARYERTPSALAKHRAYNCSPARAAAKARYRRSAKGRAVEARYRLSRAAPKRLEYASELDRLIAEQTRDDRTFQIRRPMLFVGQDVAEQLFYAGVDRRYDFV